MIDAYYLSVENMESLIAWLKDKSIHVKLTQTNSKYIRGIRRVAHENAIRVLTNYVFYKMFGPNHNIRIGHDEYGAPILSDKTYHITISHSNGYVMFAIGKSKIGGDIEKIKDEWTLEDLRKRLYFYLNKTQQQEVMTGVQPVVSAIMAWTRKESYFKVHQNRLIPEEFLITSLNREIQYEGMKFTSKMIDENMMTTVYHKANEKVNFIEIIM